MVDFCFSLMLAFIRQYKWQSFVYKNKYILKWLLKWEKKIVQNISHLKNKFKMYYLNPSFKTIVKKYHEAKTLYA